MNGPNSARNDITLAAAATWRKGVASVFARMLLANGGGGNGGGGAAVVAFLRLLPTAQFPEIFPAPCLAMYLSHKAKFSAKTLKSDFFHRNNDNKPCICHKAKFSAKICGIKGSGRSEARRGEKSGYIGKREGALQDAANGVKARRKETKG
ncbi:hypothetical protein EAG_12386 [Camponotus floridanus]|uniref:Uncharacterized protein n=1 Tax=Camponotus floridanus TaxID=104421 RepID=E2AWC3_CAMFO|nr:hypothetical protein EAG_12386 [Camponotus floridanus]